MTMRKLVSAVLGVLVIGATAFGATQLLDSPEPSDRVSALGTPGTVESTTTAGTTGTVGTTTAGDISGPCDEAEHRNDPRCTGVTVPPAATTGAVGTTTAGDI